MEWPPRLPVRWRLRYRVHPGLLPREPDPAGDQDEDENEDSDDGEVRAALAHIAFSLGVDPEALENVREIFGDRITYCDRAYGTAEGADALAVVTEWQEFRNPDFEVLRRLMMQPEMRQLPSTITSSSQAKLMSSIIA